MNFIPLNSLLLIFITHFSIRFVQSFEHIEK
nr:MAG TPA: hypothetical protein [Caudoviricetes sp.]